MNICERMRCRAVGVALLACFFLAANSANLRAQAAAPGQHAMAAAQEAQLAPPIVVAHAPNTPEQQAKPYVVLVSLDGFRYDYPQKYHARNLLALGARGVSAPDGMIPAYPSITFPNHYAIVTGLYPEHHGIVANVFYDPTRQQVYSYKDPQTEGDGTWYGGTPLWSLAEQQGMRAACFFWPGSEAEIQGKRPTYYMKYDGEFPNRARTEQVLAWLQLPPEDRPHFITLYFSDVDSAGHAHGPDSPEVGAAVGAVDAEIGRLAEGVRKLKLPVDIIVLADHGMAKVEGGYIDLDQYFDRGLLAKSVESFMYAKSDADAEKIYEALRGKSGKFNVYRAGHMPEGLHFDGNPREGDPVVVATGPYLIRVSGENGQFASPSVNPKAPDAMRFFGPPEGMHGYDPAHMKEMRAIFFAAGPDIRRDGEKLPPFENVNVYPMIARILGLDIEHLKTGPIDGRLEALRGILSKETVSTRP